MVTLYHLPWSPFCRKVRLVLAEKKIPVELKTESVWLRRPEFLELNPAGEVPVLVDDDGTVVADSVAISEYLEDTRPEPGLIAGPAAGRAEIRRLVAWFDLAFHREVYRPLFHEKVIKRLLGQGGPDSNAIRSGHAQIRYHLDYIGYLIERRRWLAGGALSVADLAAAAQLSALDYIGDVPWAEFADAKDWYSRIKSRPSFRPLLDENLPGAPPVRHYADLDF